MASRTSSLTVELIDDVSKPARTIEEALKQAETTAKQAARAMEVGSNASDKLVQSMVKLGATKADIETVAAAFRDYTHALGVGASESDTWSKEQVAAVRYWETETIGAVRQVLRERSNEAESIRRLAAEQNAQLKADIAEQVAIVKKGYDEQVIIARDSAKAQADQVRRVMQAEQDDRIAMMKETAKKEAEAQKEAQAAIINEQKKEAEAQKEAQTAVINEQKRAKEAQEDTHKTAVGVGGGLVGGMLAMTAIGDLMEGARRAVVAAGELAAARAHLKQAADHDPSEPEFVEKLTGSLSSQYPALTQKELYDTYGNLRENAIGDKGGLVDKAKAENNLRIAARAQVAALASGVEMTPADVKNLVKATDIAGRANDPHGLEKMFDSYLRYKQAGGELLTSDKILTAVSNAKAANFSMDDRSLFDVLFARATQMNPAKLGNEEAMTLTSLAGGAVQKKTAHWLESMGLVSGVTDTGGSSASFKNIVGKDLLETNQEGWANGPLLKALEAHGVLSDKNVNARMDMLRKSDPGADDKTLRENAEHGLVADAMLNSGLRNTVIDNLASLIANQRLIDRDIAGARNTSGTKAADSIGSNPVSALKELGGALLHFSEVAGGPLMMPAARAMDSMAHGIESIIKVFSAWKNPLTGKPEFLDPTPSILDPLAAADAAATEKVYNGINRGLGALTGGSDSSAEVSPYEITRPTPPHTPTPIGLQSGMSVGADTSALDAAFGKIQAIDNAQPRVRVGVDDAPLDDTIEKLQHIHRLMDSVRNNMSGVVSGLPPSLGSSQRGNFSFGGVTGE